MEVMKKLNSVLIELNFLMNDVSTMKKCGRGYCLKKNNAFFGSRIERK